MHDRELWDKLRLRFPYGWPDWLALAKAARELGYVEHAEAWERSVKW